MGSLALAVLLAQHGGGAVSGHGQLAMTIMLLTVLTVIWTSLGVVCWIFWRAKKRDDAAAAAAAARGEKESEWQSAPSS